jgi:iron(III) transport system substrate-binding protein
VIRDDPADSDDGPVRQGHAVAEEREPLAQQARVHHLQGPPAQDGGEFFERFIANGGTIVSSNGEVRRRVAAGDFVIGITDTDDFNVAREEGQPVRAVYPDEDGVGTLVIPNAAVLISGGPNPAEGQEFIDALLRPSTEQALAYSPAAQMPARPGVPRPEHVPALEELSPMQVDYAGLAAELERLSRGFLLEWVARNSR